MPALIRHALTQVYKSSPNVYWKVLGFVIDKIILVDVRV